MMIVKFDIFAYSDKKEILLIFLGVFQATIHKSITLQEAKNIFFLDSQSLKHIEAVGNKFGKDEFGDGVHEFLGEFAKIEHYDEQKLLKIRGRILDMIAKCDEIGYKMDERIWF